MPLKAVAFDVDGTLYPNASMYLRSLGLALTNTRLFLALEKARMSLRDRPPNGDFHQAQAEEVAQILGLPADRVRELIEDRVYTRWFRIFPRLPLFRDLVDTIQSFRNAGLKLGVLSDFPIRNRLHDLGLEGPWDCAFSSEETGYLKPHPRSFELLAERLGVGADEVLYVGNSYHYDVLGAHAAGMPAAHLTKTARSGSLAVLTFSQYKRLAEFVFRTREVPGYNRTTGRVSS